MAITVKIERSKQRPLSTRAWKKTAKAWAGEIEALCVEALKREAPVYHFDRNDPGSPIPGKLRDSIQAKAEVTTSNAAIEFYTNVPYAMFVIHGTAAHVITPRGANVLHWDEGGVHHFRSLVHHPGTKKNDFVTRALAPLVPVISAKFRSTMIAGLEGA